MNKRIFLVDFENVHSEGLAGVDSLTENDDVVIFHSINADTITFEMMHKLMFSKAKLSYYKVRRGGKNALDFQLSSYLGYLISTQTAETEKPDIEFYMISKDAGFDFVIDFWESGNIDVKPKIKRFYSVKAVLSQNKDAKTLKRVPVVKPIAAPAVAVTPEAKTAIPENPVTVEKSVEAEKPAAPEKPIIPEEKIVFPEEKIIFPKEKAVVSEEKIVIPEEKIVFPEEKAVVSEEKIVFPEEKAVIPKEKTVIPKAKTAIPKAKPAVPKAKPAVSKSKPAASKAKPTVPEAESVTPENTPVTDEMIVMVEPAPEAAQAAEMDIETVAEVDKLLSESKSSHELYIGMVKRFGQKKGVEIYRNIKPRFAAKKTG